MAMLLMTLLACAAAPAVAGEKVMAAYEAPSAPRERADAETLNNATVGSVLHSVADGPVAAFILDDPDAAAPLAELIADRPRFAAGDGIERKGPGKPEEPEDSTFVRDERPASDGITLTQIIEEKWRAADDLHYEDFFKAHR